MKKHEKRFGISRAALAVGPLSLCLDCNPFVTACQGFLLLFCNFSFSSQFASGLARAPSRSTANRGILWFFLRSLPWPGQTKQPCRAKYAAAGPVIFLLPFYAKVMLASNAAFSSRWPQK